MALSTLPTIPGYRIKKTIGKGGMAVVYLAIQESLDRPVALKLLSDPDTPQFHERFMNEGRCIAALGHSSVVPIHDIGWVGDHYYISMEYLPNSDLKTRIAKGIKPARALKIAAKIAGCLDYVHRQGIVHRDLKPSNILFRSDGTPVLTDFGIAKMAQKDNELTITGTVLGSPHYLSPEQANGMKAVDGRSDLYSLGIILFEMLTGEKPYQSESFAGTVIAHLNDPVPKLPKSLTHLQSLLDRLLAKKPEERYQTGGEVVQAIQDLDPKKKADNTTGDSVPIQATPKGRTRLADITRTLPIKSMLGRTSNLKLAIAGGTVLAFLFATGLSAVYLGDDPAPEKLASTESVPAEPASPQASNNDPTADSSAKADSYPPSDQPGVIQPEQEQIVTPVETASDPAKPAEPQEVAKATDPVEPVEKIENPAPRVSEQPSVDDLLKLAEKRSDEFRLSVPEGDNAVHYYQEVLRMDPGNSQAETGLDAVAGKYASLARRELARDRLRKASQFIRQGLSVRENKPELLLLRNQLAKRRSVLVNAWRHPTISDHGAKKQRTKSKKKSEVFDPLAGISE